MICILRGSSEDVSDAEKCMLSRGERNPCREDAMPGDVLCPFHARYFRRRCTCGRRTAGPNVERRHGLCWACWEKTTEYQRRRWAAEKARQCGEEPQDRLRDVAEGRHPRYRHGEQIEDETGRRDGTR